MELQWWFSVTMRNEDIDFTNKGHKRQAVDVAAPKLAF